MVDTDHGRHGNVAAPRAGFRALMGFAGYAAVALGLALDPVGAAHANSIAGVGAAKPLSGPALQSITLPTGEQVTIAVEGGSTAYVPSGGSGFLTYQAADSDQYVVPAEARPYLGRQLDPSLFDVSALLRAHLGVPAARVPVGLGFAPGSKVSAPPGVTLTSVGGASASGYLTAGSASVFAAALRASIGADVAGGRPAGSGPLFGGLISMSLAVPGAGPGSGAGAVAPRYPLTVLQINAADLTGAPADNAEVFLVDTDSVARWHGIVPIAAGIGRVAVPAGHYSAAANFADFDTQGNLTAIRTVALNDFTVAASGTSTVGFDERAATVPFNVSTPRQATQDSLVVGWFRTDATGAASGFEGAAEGLVRAYSNTEAHPAIGSVQYVVQWGGTGTAAGPAYRYDLAFTTEGIPANQNHRVSSGQLATVHQNLYTDPTATAPGQMYESVYEPSFEILMPTPPVAGVVTDYMGVGTPDRWQQDYLSPTGFFLTSSMRQFTAGHAYNLEWAHGPLAPNDGTYGLGLPNPCFACVSGSDMSVGFNEVADSEPDHVGIPVLGGSTHYTLYQNGVEVVDAVNAVGADLAAIPNAPTTYREVFDTDLSNVPGLTESTSTHTELTFHYVPGTDPDQTLPAAVSCSRNGSIAAPCQILPILNLDYHLATDLTGTSRSSVQAMRFDVSHLTYLGHGSHAPITAASVSVSFDGGKSWTPAAVAGTAGHYLARWRNPASAGAVSPEIRVTARDAAGGSISQTVVNAYVTAASAH
jgi:hypothetical protein